MKPKAILVSLFALLAASLVQFACDSIDNVDLGTPVGNPTDDAYNPSDGDGSTDDDDDNGSDALVQPGLPGTISGRAVFANNMLEKSPKLLLFRVGDRFDAIPVEEDSIPNTPGEGSSTGFDFTFENIPQGTYRLAAYLDLNESTETFPIEYYYFPALLPVTATEGAAIDGFYVALYNPAYGRIRGSVVVPSDVTGLTVELRLFGQTSNDTPVSLDYAVDLGADGASRRLEYEFLNLGSDTYRVVAVAYICGLDTPGETATKMLGETVLVNRNLSATLENMDKNIEFTAAELTCSTAADGDDTK